MKKESEKDRIKRRMTELNEGPGKERFVICGDCKNNDETCSLCAPSLCISGSNFEQKVSENDKPMTTMAHDAVSCETCGVCGVGWTRCGACDDCDDYNKWVPKNNDRFVQDRAFAETACPTAKRPAATPEPEQAKDPKARYYDAGGIEVLDVIKAKLTPDQYKGWLLGNLIKYSCRANFKDQLSRDIEKVAFYSAEMFKFLEL